MRAADVVAVAIVLGGLAGPAWAQPDAVEDQVNLQFDPVQTVAADGDAAAVEPAPPSGSAAEDLDTIPVDVSGAPESIEASEEPQAVGIEEVVVTAQKREERLLDVPISISAFSGEQLDNAGVKQLSDLAFKTPGLVFDTQLNYAIIFIRGVGTDAFVPSADMSVAPYVDGVYFPNSFGLARAVGEVERVEVLKGPQGTLFGRNATAGAISVVTKKPSKYFTMSADTSYGSDHETNNRLSISGPIGGDKLSGTLSLLYNYKDEYYEFTEPSYPGEPQSSIERGGRLKLFWEPSEWLDLTLSGFMFNSLGIGTTLMTCLEPTGLGVVLNMSCEQGRKTNVNAYQANWADMDVVSLTGGLHFDGLDIKSISAYQTSATSAFNDYDGSSSNIATFTAPPPDALMTKAFTQEIQFLSTPDSFGAEYMKWVAGLYYINSSLSYDGINIGLLGTDNGLAGLASGDLLGIPLDFLEPILDPLGPDLLSLALKITGALDTDAYAGFTQVTFMPMDWLDVTLGGRWQHEERTVFNSALKLNLTVLGQTLEPSLLPWPDDTREEDTFSPKVSVAVKPSRDSMIYASWQRAHKSGSFNVLNITQPPTTIRPETVTTTELGAKTMLFGKKVQINAAVFNNDIEDLQSQFLSLLSGGVVQFQNAPKAHSRGGEFDLQWAAAPGLLLNAAATYLESEYDEFPDANGFNEAGIFTSGLDNTGNEIVRNPKWTASAGLGYEIALGRGIADFGADYYYNGGYWFDAQNTLVQPSYSLLNLRIGYLYEPWNLKISLAGTNVTDADYYILQYQSDFAEAGKMAMGRGYAVKLHWEF